MKTHLSVLAVSLAVLAACASSSVKKYDYPATTNATEEIRNLESEMTTAVHNQVDVLAPNHFAAAREKLDDAKKESQNRESNADILEDLGYAKAHLDAANASAPRAEAAMPEVLKARNDALAAEAVRLRNADLIDADQALKKTTEDFENGTPTVSVEKRGELQRKYLDVELAATKVNYLDQARALLEAAKKMGAEKYAEKTYDSAKAKYQAAARTIESDRHNTAAIVRASDEATVEAKHAIEITRLAKGMKEESPEEAAIALDAKRNEAARNAAMAERNADRLANARDTIRDKNSEIAATDAERARLAKEARFNQAFETARASFSPDEAEVYRQGDNLVVRLKSMKFPVGRAELPASSFAVLDKVNNVITTLGAEKVVVEGHTDATGSHAKNQTLSEKRADAVAKYFVAEDALPQDKIDAKGFGDSKPLASNKTAQGRAQNRRVDIVISAANPTMANTNSSEDRTSSSMSSATRASDNDLGASANKPKPSEMTPPAPADAPAKNPPAQPKRWED